MLCLRVFLLWYCTSVALADILASSKIETCVRDGTQGATQVLSCKNRMVVTMTVAAGSALATEELQLSMDCVGSADGICPCKCDYAVDSSCTCRDLQQSLVVRLTKSPVAATYPLTYLQSFNWRPYETVQKSSDNKCRDGDYDTNPTCGWFWVATKKVADSQGFCCTCSTSQIWDDTLGSSKQRTRANLDCGLFADFGSIITGSPPASAHCLQFDPLWFGGYLMGSATLTFQISASLTTSNGTEPGALGMEVLALSPSVPVALSSGGTLKASLLGDLAGYTQLPVLSEKVLMIPQPSGATLNDILRSDRSNWLLVDKSAISFDGGQCDKVGTSFAAFRFQASGCARAVGTCLANQLKDLYERDLIRITEGKAPLYLLSQYTYGTNMNLTRISGGPLSLALPVQGQGNSVVTLVAAADSLRFITNSCPGKISGARVCQFAATSCGGFEAMAARGYLQANITNTGLINASYTLSVTNCSVNIQAVEAQRLTLPPGKPTPASAFQIYIQDDKAVADRYCWLVLFDSQARVTDKVQVVFYTNATEYTPIPSGGLQGNGSTLGTPKSSKSCDQKCGGFASMACFAANRCWGKMGKALGALMGTLGAVGLLAVALKMGLIPPALGMLRTLLCGCSSDPDPPPRRQAHARKHSSGNQAHVEHSSKQKKKKKKSKHGDPPESQLHFLQLQQSLSAGLPATPLASWSLPAAYSPMLSQQALPAGLSYTGAAGGLPRQHYAAAASPYASPRSSPHSFAGPAAVGGLALSCTVQQHQQQRQDQHHQNHQHHQQHQQHQYQHQQHQAHYQQLQQHQQHQQQASAASQRLQSVQLGQQSGMGTQAARMLMQYVPGGLPLERGGHAVADSAARMQRALHMGAQGQLERVAQRLVGEVWGRGLGYGSGELRPPVDNPLYRTQHIDNPIYWTHD